MGKIKLLVAILILGTLAGCVDGNVLDGYEITINLIERSKPEGHEQEIPWSDVKVFYSGTRVKSGEAGPTNEQGRVTIGALRGEVHISFLLDGYETPIHLLTVKQAGHYEVSPVARMAPNMYIDCMGDGEYDVISIDWYCEEDAPETYWAVHNWETGYAGFQCVDGRHVLLMSLWDLDDGTEPIIEWVKDGHSGRFGGEGTGAQLLTEYPWKEKTWYTMRIQTWAADEKTYYEQWIREEEGEWIRTGLLSYPSIGPRFSGTSMFQEDFTYNNASRSCRIRNAYGRYYGTTSWDSWDRYLVSNTYFAAHPSDWNHVFWNIDYNADWDIDVNLGYVWLQSGGGQFTSSGKRIPITYVLDQPAQPLDGRWLTD